MYRNLAKSTRLTVKGSEKLQLHLPKDQQGNPLKGYPLYDAIARMPDAPSRNTIGRILERQNGVNHQSLLQLFLAFGLLLSDPDWEMCATETVVEENIDSRTIVFTDMERSTELWNRFGMAFEPISQRHNELLSQIARKHQGEVVKSTGDGFLLVFKEAAMAFHFAIEAQIALNQEDWESWCTGVTAIKVRMGIHTGEVVITRDANAHIDYIGPAVNLASRIADAAHAQQVLVCDTSRRAIHARLGEANHDFKDCGQHELKDFDKGVWLWQPLVGSLPRDFETIIRKPTPVPAHHGGNSTGSELQSKSLPSKEAAIPITLESVHHGLLKAVGGELDMIVVGVNAENAVPQHQAKNARIASLIEWVRGDEIARLQSVYQTAIKFSPSFAAEMRRRTSEGQF